MGGIKIKNQMRAEGAWVFSVEVGGESYAVTVDDDYLLRLTGGKDRAEDLVKRSFEFLLARESKESILRQFNLRQIRDYFPEYETEVKTR